MNFIKGTLLFLTLMSLAPAVRGEAPESGRWELMNLMHTFEREFSNLRPYLVSDEKFKDPKAKPEIQKSLKALEEAVRSDRPAKIDKNPNFSLNFSLLSYHIQRINRAFDRGGLEYVRRDLNATAHFCATCHTQIPTPKGERAGLWTGPETDVATLENAEFLFITRRFDAALAKYNDLVRKFPKSGLKKEQIPEVYNRKLALFSRVMREPQVAIENLQKDLESKELPDETKANIKTWIDSFKTWQAEKSKVETMPVDEFLKYVAKLRPATSARKLDASDPEVIRSLRISGRLYELLVKDSSGKHSQEILYDLALFEKQLSQLYWYSLHQSYLRECVVKYPKKPLTKTCFDLYEADIREEFASQLRGLPEDMRQAIEALRKNL